MFCKQRIWMMNGSLFPDMTFSPNPFSLKCSSALPSDLLKVNFYLVLNYFLPPSTLVPSLIYTGCAFAPAPESMSQPWAGWQHMRVRMGRASSSWAWASLGRKTGLGGRQGNVENGWHHRTRLIPLSLGKRGGLRFAWDGSTHRQHHLHSIWCGLSPFVYISVQSSFQEHVQDSKRDRRMCRCFG